ncbi:Zinc finger CCCH-type protein [Venturia nashicola]|uniref:EKC/KEOPS complex subunit CGI121 n=1 Tax=Venturia nashicola TaxID=86259 RepID=A0A4Z1NS34_9PEZI|nr:Zinc finger CCCH-type protein [Venturia nashicola]
MVSASVIRLPHLPYTSVHVSLFKDVKNAAFLRKQLMEGNAEFEYAFLDATMIISVNHVLAAVFRAINDSSHGRMKSRNVHSEIVFSLSPNNNIAESFRRFGVLDTTTNLLAVKVIDSTNMLTASDPSIHLSESVEGNRIEFNDANLKETADIPRLIKIYKLTAGTDMPSSGKRGKGPRGGSNAAPEQHPNGTTEEVDQVKEMEAVMLGTMALKGS